jgi:hypothetical protein
LGVWQNRYQTPAADALLGELGPDARVLAEEALKRLGRKPKPVWVVLWNWTLWIDAPDRGPVLIVPDPARLLIVARVARAFFEEHLAAQPARGPRDPIANASCVGDAVWLEWTPETPAALDVVFRVIRPD